MMAMRAFRPLQRRLPALPPVRVDSRQPVLRSSLCSLHCYHHYQPHSRPVPSARHLATQAHSHSQPPLAQSLSQSQPQSEENERSRRQRRRPVITLLSRASAAAAIVGGVVLVSDVLVKGIDEARSDVRIIVRFLRTSLTFATIAADFKWTWWHNPEGSAGYAAATEAVHARTAERLFQLAMANKGLYIKTGQYMASATHVLPPVYGLTLKPLQDAAPVMSPADLHRLLSEEFPEARSFDDLFINFNYQPLAAASIAQVHEAYLSDGQKVAVKLQHPNLKKEFGIDLFAHYCVLRVAEMLFPSFALSWMHDEIAENLTKELDFINEANNSELAARWFAVFENDTVKIPRIVWTRTTSRILTMEFCSGVKISDTERLEAAGVNVLEALSETLKALSEQIFLHGFVHSDPHPGNVFIHKEDVSGKLRVVLLDWGLCRAMREDVRVHYCELWEALILNDDDKVKLALGAMGVNVADDSEHETSAWELIAFSILMRPYTASKKKKKNKSMDLVRKMTPAEMAELRTTINARAASWLSEFANMPRELLLILRTQNYLRYLNYEIGRGKVNRFRIMARTAVRGKDIRHAETVIIIPVGGSHPSSSSSPQVLELQPRSARAKLSALLHRLHFEYYLLREDLIRWLGQQWLHYFAPVELTDELNALVQSTGEDARALFGG